MISLTSFKESEISLIEGGVIFLGMRSEVVCAVSYESIVQVMGEEQALRAFSVGTERVGVHNVSIDCVQVLPMSGGATRLHLFASH